MSYSGPIVVGEDGRASDVTLDQLSVQRLFEVQHDSANDDSIDQHRATLMQGSAAQLAHADTGTSDKVHDDDSTKVPTLAGVLTGRQPRSCTGLSFGDGRDDCGSYQIRQGHKCLDHTFSRGVGVTNAPTYLFTDSRMEPTVDPCVAGFVFSRCRMEPTIHVTIH